MLDYQQLALLTAGTLGISLLVHAVALVAIGRLFRLDWDVLAVGSQASFGGPVSAAALAETLDRSDLVVPERCVSREHAVVELRAGRATVTDKSSTGSWILDGEGGYTTLRREAATLPGSGILRLGCHPRDSRPAPEVRFSLRAIA